MRRLVTSYASHLRYPAAFEFIAGCQGQEMLLVASSRPAADELIHRYCSVHQSAFGIHRFTLPALAAEIAAPQLGHDSVSAVSGVAIDALTARAAHACRTRGSLSWFDRVASTTGFSRSLASTLRELRLNAVPAPTLAAIEDAAALDLADLTREFEHGMLDAKVTDLAEIYRIAANTASRFHGLPLLLLDPGMTSAVERDFIASLVQAAPAVLATTHSRNETGIAALESLLGVLPECCAENTGSAMDRLRLNIFSTGSPPSGSLDNSVDFRSATDESREAVEIARSILLLAEQPLTFDQTAILLRNPDLYQPLIEEALQRARIPAHFTLGVRKPNPTGRAFLALLACAAEGLSAVRFSEYLSIGQVPYCEENSAPDTPDPHWVPIQGELFPDPPTESTPAAEHKPEKTVRAPYRWERLLVDAAVIGSRARWEQRLDGLRREFEKQIAEAGMDNEPLRLRIEREQDQLADLRRFALPLLEAIEKLPSGETWQAWLDSLERLATISLRHPDPVLSVLAELRPMSAIGPIHIDEVREVLTHRLTFLRVETGERRYGRVFVGTIPEAAGMSFHAVFVPGVGEGLFPQRTSEDPLLLDELRSKLSPSLSIQATRVEQERFLFHTAAAAASNRLFISYPRMTLTGERSRGPSFYALEVFRAIHGRVPALQELLRTTAEASHLQAGWPAPREAAKAIDEAEYDLAVIHRLTRTNPSERQGAARYLLSANSNLARSLYARSRRWRSKWTESDGLVNGSDTLLAILETYRLSATPHSATGLQQFAACPYQFFLHSLVRLEPRATLQTMERMDPLTRGSLFHTIQFRLLTTLRTAGLMPIADANREQILETADTIVDTTAMEYRDLLSPAISRVWNDEVEDIRWDIRGWLREMERPSIGGHWLPRWFELGFGVRNQEDSDPESSALHVTLRNGMQLHGSIDLIEERNGALRVTDHKTGKAPLAVPALTGHGEILQPLLYGQVAEILLKRQSIASRLFYCTDRGGYRVVEIPVHEEAQREIGQVLTTIDRSIAEGFLPAAPRKGACEYCDYRLVCGPYEEVRLQRKNSERLSPLDQIRRTP